MCFFFCPNHQQEPWLFVTQHRSSTLCQVVSYIPPNHQQEPWLFCSIAAALFVCALDPLIPTYAYVLVGVLVPVYAHIPVPTYSYVYSYLYRHTTYLCLRIMHTYLRTHKYVHAYVSFAWTRRAFVYVSHIVTHPCECLYSACVGISRKYRLF